tara:strand:+ start:322 stop:744 length:423 start_codon:yes stop_codon:yes gene_type:complete
MNILSIDHGLKRIGLAIGNSDRKIATPISHINNMSEIFVIDQIKSIIKDYEIEEIIIGIPLDEDGNDSLQSDKVRKFAYLLKKNVNLKLFGIDERFSSVDSEKILIDVDLSRKKRKKNIDSLSASIILQRYFDGNKIILL